MRAICMVIGLAAAAVLVPSEAHAGVTAPLSSLSSLPAPAAPKTPEAVASVPGASLKTKDGYGATKWHDLNAATGRGYCFSTSENGSRWTNSWGTSSKSPASDVDLDRLVEKDGKVTLERTKLRFDPTDASLTLKGRSQVELHEIARTPAGIVVWAFREGRDVIILARNIERGVESRRGSSDDVGMPFVSSDGCPYGGARLDARRPDAGSAVQLTGALAPQGTGKEKVTPRFLIDASVARVSRDPEAKIAVRVRMLDLPQR